MIKYLEKFYKVIFSTKHSLETFEFNYFFVILIFVLSCVTLSLSSSFVINDEYQEIMYGFVDAYEDVSMNNVKVSNKILQGNEISFENKGKTITFYESYYELSENDISLSTEYAFDFEFNGDNLAKKIYLESIIYNTLSINSLQVMKVELFNCLLSMGFLTILLTSILKVFDIRKKVFNQNRVNLSKLVIINYFVPSIIATMITLICGGILFQPLSIFVFFLMIKIVLEIRNIINSK